MGYFCDCLEKWKHFMQFRLSPVQGNVCLNGAMSVCVLTPGPWHGVFLVHSSLRSWHGRAKWTQLGPCSHDVALIWQNKAALYNPSTNEVMALSIKNESALMSPMTALTKAFFSFALGQKQMPPLKIIIVTGPDVMAFQPLLKDGFHIGNVVCPWWQIVWITFITQKLESEHLSLNSAFRGQVLSIIQVLQLGSWAKTKGWICAGVALRLAPHTSQFGYKQELSSRKKYLPWNGLDHVFMNAAQCNVCFPGLFCMFGSWSINYQPWAHITPMFSPANMVLFPIPALHCWL